MTDKDPAVEAIKQLAEDALQNFSIIIHDKNGIVHNLDDILGFRVSDTAVMVMTKNSESYIWPLANVSFIEHFPVKDINNVA